MLRVATVLSAREWEARFVAAARDSAALRLVLRAYLPDEVTRQASGIDVVVAGAETPWVTPTRIASWRRLGLRVVGVHQQADRPAAERLSAGGADLVLDEGLTSEQLVREIRLLQAERDPQRSRLGKVVAVTGVRGGPGRTEIAVALAWSSAKRSDTALLDADLAGPSVAVRLGLPPRPDLADCVDRALDGTSVAASMQTVGRLRVVPGALRPTGVRPEAVLDVAESAASEWTVVVDAGPWTEASTLLHAADQVVFVVDASPVGIVRASQIVDSWDGPPPSVVLNKVSTATGGDSIAALRRWCGLEPVAVVPRRRRIRSAAATGGAPHSSIVRAVQRVIENDSGDA